MIKPANVAVVGVGPTSPSIGCLKLLNGSTGELGFETPPLDIVLVLVLGRLGRLRDLGGGGGGIAEGPKNSIGDNVYERRGEEVMRDSFVWSLMQGRMWM
jgi:hypothetical protein